MFSKSTTNSSFDIGNPKPSIIKKKARNTILNVLTKRQTQERVFVDERKNSPVQERTAWRQEPTARPNEQGVMKIGTRQISGRNPKIITSPINKTVPQQSSRAPSSPVQYFQKPPAQAREADYITKGFEKETSRCVAEPVVFKTSTNTFQTQNSSRSPANVSNMSQKLSDEGSKSPVQKSPREYYPRGCDNSPRVYDISPKRVNLPGTVDSSSPGSPRIAPGDDKGFSMIVQSSTSYPPPIRRKSSADVVPYNVTVNTIRIYEATHKMVEADPEILSRLDRYPSRAPPVMSPTSQERFTWEKDQLTGIEREKRAVVRAGIPIKQRPQMDSSSSDSVLSPTLVSDSVQVSIPFGVPGSPTSPRESDSGSDSWTSSVSVCVPFQITENEGVKALPVRGGARPQSLPPADGKLAIEALKELNTKSDAGSSSPHSPDRENIRHLYDPSMDSEDFIMGKSQSYKTNSTGERSPGGCSDGPKLVTVRRRPVEETVQKIKRFDDALLQRQPASGESDIEDGMALSKHGTYSLANQKNEKTVPETTNKGSPVLTRAHLGSPKTEPPSRGQNKASFSTSSQRTSTLPTTGHSLKKDEIEMLKARIRQLEAELEQERQKQAPSEKILASIPILEKEKLRLQAQVNETVQELSKAKSQLHSANYASNKHEAEKDLLEVKYKRLQKDFDRLKSQNEQLEFERDQLLREKKNRMNENERDQEANLITIQSLSKQNDELIASESKLKDRICTLVRGLKEVKESVKKVREENVLLHDEIVDNGISMADTMKKCVYGLQQVVEQMNSESGNSKNQQSKTGAINDSTDNDEIIRLKEELQDSKTCVHALLQRVIELESTERKTGDSEKSGKELNYDGCPNCAKLREELQDLRLYYDEQKQAFEKMEMEFEEISNENEDIQQEVKYLKKVLSYREDVMQVQVSQKTTRQLQRLETNLEEAEKKCKDLEDEVGRLHNQKQSLLVNILKLHEEEVAADNGEEENDDDDEDDDDDDDGMSDDQNSRFSFNRSKSSNKRAMYGNNEAEFSSGASFYESESESESDEWSELEDTSQRLRDYVKGIVSERKRLRSNVKELMAEKRNLNRRVDKSSDDFKSLMKRMQKLDSENVFLREKVKKDRRTLKSKLKEEERESERLREKLKETEGEKEALMKCIEMNSSNQQVEAEETTEDLDNDDVSRLIAKAQAFALEEKDTKKEESSEESEEGDEDKEDEEDGEEEENKEEEKKEESEEESSSSSGEEDVIKPPVSRTRTRARPQPHYRIKRKPESEEERKRLRDEEERKEEEDDIVKDEMDDIIKSPPPPHARLLQRRASTIGINMDRVNREKQHLEEEVASLRKYLNRSATRRRFSTVEAPKTPPLSAMKTLESLLQKSDMELKEANAKISRLQSLNADMEERIKDFEVMQDDLRRAVVIANNYAAEEREKNNALEEEKDELMQKLDELKRENSRLKKSRAINAVYRKGTRSVKSMSANEEDSDGADVESDFSSLSRKSSNASDI